MHRLQLCLNCYPTFAAFTLAPSAKCAPSAETLSQTDLHSMHYYLYALPDNCYIVSMRDPCTGAELAQQLPSDTHCTTETVERHYARINRMSDSMKALVDPKLVQAAREYGKCW